MKGPSHSRNVNTASAQVLYAVRNDRFQRLPGLQTSAAYARVPTLADSLSTGAQSCLQGSSGNSSSMPDSRQSGSQNSAGSMTGSGSCGAGPQYASGASGCARAENAAMTAGGVSGRK